MSTTTTTEEHTMNATATAQADYTETTVSINGVEVTIYDGAKRAVSTFATTGHVTGWLKRNGASTTYAELTCTCHLVGEATFPEGRGSWTSYGQEGWAERLTAQAEAHIHNATANAFMVRPAGGDADQKADRHRVNLAGLLAAMKAAGVTELDAFATVMKGRHVYAPDGTRFELAADRSPFASEVLPIA